MAVQEKLYTADDLWEMSAQVDGEKRLELIEGAVYQMTPTGGEHGEVVWELTLFIGNHVKAHQLGRVTAAETGYRLAPKTVLAPDIGFISAARVPERLPKKYISMAPDLAVEVISPSDSYSRTMKKVSLFLCYGTRLVWLVDPDEKTVAAHSSAGVRPLTVDDTLEGGDVLPGFRLPVKDIFPK